MSRNNAKGGRPEVAVPNVYESVALNLDGVEYRLVYNYRAIAKAETLINGGRPASEHVNLLMGLFGLSIPDEYDGIGLSMSQEVQVAYEVGRTALAFRSVFGTNVGIGVDHTLFALVDGHVSFAVKGAMNKHTVSVTAA